MIRKKEQYVPLFHCTLEFALKPWGNLNFPSPNLPSLAPICTSSQVSTWISLSKLWQFPYKLFPRITDSNEKNDSLLGNIALNLNITLFFKHNKISKKSYNPKTVSTASKGFQEQIFQLKTQIKTLYINRKDSSFYNTLRSTSISSNLQSSILIIECLSVKPEKNFQKVKQPRKILKQV